MMTQDIPAPSMSRSPTARELELEDAIRRIGSRKEAAHALGIKDSTAAVHLRNLNRRRGTPGRRVLREDVVIPQETALE